MLELAPSTIIESLSLLLIFKYMTSLINSSNFKSDESTLRTRKNGIKILNMEKQTQTINKIYKVTNTPPFAPNKQSLHYINASTVSGNIELRYQSRILPPRLIADLDATVVTGIQSTSLASLARSGYLYC